METVTRRDGGRSRTLRIAAIALLIAVLVGAGFAYTAANTVQESRAGEGSNTITGYNVNSVHYTLNAADPTKIDAVTFTLDSVPAAGSTVRARLSTTGSWYSCTNTGVNVTCATTSPVASVGSTADQLSVVVAQ